MKKTGTRFGNFVGGGVFIITAGMFLFFLVSNAVDVVRLRLQPAIVFRVVNTEIVPADSGKSGFDLVVRFQQPGRSEVERAELNRSDYRDLAVLQKTLSPGSSVVGRRLPPNSPTRLDICESFWSLLLALFGMGSFTLMFVLVGAHAAFGALTGRELIPVGFLQDSKYPLFIGGTFLLGFGCIPVTAIGVIPVVQWARSHGWVATPATIEMSRVTVSTGSKGGRSYNPEVLYRYSWNGTWYRSSRIGTGDFGTETGTRMFVGNHPVGKAVTCLVNAADPSDAMLDRRLSAWTLLSLPFCVFPFLGVVLLRAGWRARNVTSGRIPVFGSGRRGTRR
jgi:hypothetical protein